MGSAGSLPLSPARDQDLPEPMLPYPLSLRKGARRTRGAGAVAPRTLLAWGILSLVGASCHAPSPGTAVERDPVPPAPAPGSVHFLGRAAACTLASLPTRCDVEIIRVLEYGAGAPSSPPGTVVSIQVTKLVLGLGEASAGQDALPSGVLEFIADASLARGPAGTTTQWRLMRVSFPSRTHQTGGGLN
jgi:hypothetical protein